MAKRLLTSSRDKHGRKFYLEWIGRAWGNPRWVRCNREEAELALATETAENIAYDKILRRSRKGN